MESELPDVYLVSKFPGLAVELRKALPSHANLIVCTLTDSDSKSTIRWDQSLAMSDADYNLVKEAEVLVMDATFLSSLLYKLPKAKWVQSTWAGIEMLMSKFDESKPHPNFVVTRYADPYFGELLANYVIAEIINIERGFFTYHEKQKTAEWSRPFFPDFKVLSELTVGILGAGKLGSAVGRLLKKCGVHVIVYVRNPRHQTSNDFDEATTDLCEILSKSDYICNVLPSTPETTGLLDNDVLKGCIKKPVFINIGRGDIITEDSIIKALSEKWISKAVLDVFPTEPLPKSSALWNTPDVHITPHVGAIPRIAGIAKYIADNYDKYINKKPLMNTVDWSKGY